MTVIAAAVTNNMLTMAGDRAYSDDEQIYIAKQPKLVKPNSCLVVGVAGTADICQDVLEMDWPAFGKLNHYKYVRLLNTHFKQLFKEYDDEPDLYTLIGVRILGEAKLYSWHSGVILEHDYHAIGSGGLVAIGSLYSVRSVDIACQAAIEHCSGCGGPVDVYTI